METPSPAEPRCAPRPRVPQDRSSCVLVTLFALGQVLDPVQARPPVVLDDGPEWSQGRLVGAVDAAVAFASFAEEAGVLEHPNVLTHRGPGHLEVCGDVAGRELAVPDQLEDPEPARGGD